MPLRVRERYAITCRRRRSYELFLALANRSQAAILLVSAQICTNTLRPVTRASGFRNKVATFARTSTTIARTWVVSSRYASPSTSALSSLFIRRFSPPTPRLACFFTSERELPEPRAGEGEKENKRKLEAQLRTARIMQSRN